MSDCPHHWTVTSECPQCLRALYDGACARVRELEADLARVTQELTETAAARDRAQAETRQLDAQGAALAAKLARCEGLLRACEARGINDIDSELLMRIDAALAGGK